MATNRNHRMNPGPQYVRVINVGQRFGRGFNRLEGANPVQRVVAWAIAIIIGIPLALLLGFFLLVAIGIALMFGIISWLLGRPVRRSMHASIARPGQDPQGTSAPGRENVKVVANER